jgi:hypothetical protein
MSETTWFAAPATNGGTVLEREPIVCPRAHAWRARYAQTEEKTLFLQHKPIINGYKPTHKRVAQPSVL